jgi:hypothetical protein
MGKRRRREAYWKRQRMLANVALQLTGGEEMLYFPRNNVGFAGRGERVRVVEVVSQFYMLVQRTWNGDEELINVAKRDLRPIK